MKRISCVGMMAAVLVLPGILGVAQDIQPPQGAGAALEQRPCGRCVGRHGERVFGDCEGLGGTWVAQECDEAQLSARRLLQNAERRRQEERERKEELDRYQERMKAYDWRAPSGVTLAGFNRIRDGMGRDLVEHILGRPGELRASQGRHSIYGWHADRGYGNMTVSFEGGVVIGKAQAGLQ